MAHRRPAWAGKCDLRGREGRPLAALSRRLTGSRLRRRGDAGPRSIRRAPSALGVEGRAGATVVKWRQSLLCTEPGCREAPGDNRSPRFVRRRNRVSSVKSRVGSRPLGASQPRAGWRVAAGLIRKVPFVAHVLPAASWHGWFRLGASDGETVLDYAMVAAAGPFGIRVHRIFEIQTRQEGPSVPALSGAIAPGNFSRVHVVKISDQPINPWKLPAILVGFASNAFLVQLPELGKWIGYVSLVVLSLCTIYGVVILITNRFIPRRFANLVYVLDDDHNLAVIKHPFHERWQPPGSRLGYHEAPHLAVGRASRKNSVWKSTTSSSGRKWKGQSTEGSNSCSRHSKSRPKRGDSGSG